MIHKHIKSVPHHPKRVILISLIIATIIGTFAYIKINKKVAIPVVEDNSNINGSGGVVLPSANLTLGFLTGGRIKSVSVKAGDKVKKGQVLATLDAGNVMGALAQAKAASETAKANYEKIINGATGPTIDVAKATVRTAEVNLDEITKQQGILVDNAHRTLLNSSLLAQSVSNDEAFVSPIITGTYSCQEGSYNLEIYASSGGYALKYSGLEEGTLFLTDVPRPLGACGLFLSFDKTKTPFSGAKFTIQIPNESAANFNINSNAYQLALQTKEQAIASAQATLDQANASLSALASTARPEDVAAAQAQEDNAQGAVQIAEAAYENTIITAPSDGTIVSIIISPGQIATQSAPAIEFISSTN